MQETLDGGSVDMEEVGGTQAPRHPTALQTGDKSVRRRRVVFHVMRWTRALLLPFVAIAYWLGLWNFLDRYVFPESSIARGVWWRDLLYIALGLAGIVVLKMWWPSRRAITEGPFSWSRQMLRFTRLLITVTLAIVFWTGAWNLLDNGGWPSSIWRELFYIGASLPLLVLLDVFCNSKSLRHWLHLEPTEGALHDDDADDETISTWN